MLRISRHCRRTPAQVLDRAADFFGDRGEGLETTGRNPCCISFEGLGGHVTVTAAEAPGGSEVEVVAREFEYQAKRFVDSL